MIFADFGKNWPDTISDTSYIHSLVLSQGAFL